MSESIFGAQPQPTSTQVGGGYEIGIHFNSSSAGNVSGLAFYKAAADTTTLSRTLSLWSGAGALLTSVTTSAEPTGTDQWLVGALASPYAIQAVQDYVVSFGSPGVYKAIPGGTTPVSNGQHLTLTSCCYGNTIGAFPNLADTAELDLADLAFAVAQAAQTRLSAPIPAISVAVPGELTTVMNGVVAALNQTFTANSLPALPYFSRVKIVELPAALNTVINNFNNLLDHLGWDASNHLPPADVTSYRQPTQLINVMVNAMNKFA